MPEASPSGRWVAVFNGARDGYQLPIALQEASRLEALVTDWYSPLDVSAVRIALPLLPSRVRETLARRYRAGLPSARVHSRLGEAIRQIRNPSEIDRVDRALGRYAGDLARTRGSGVFSYNFYAHEAFRAARNSAAPRFLFQSQAHPSSVRDAMLAALQGARSREERLELEAEPEFLGKSTRYADLCEEPHLADRCVAPSAYVMRTLVENGVDMSRIDVIPYGVDLDQFYPGPRVDPTGPFRVMYAGQLIRRKGVGYLLDAWEKLALPNAELVLVGRGRADRTLVGTQVRQVRFEANVNTRSRMRQLYQESDVVCLPSLTDSFGHVLLEALACATPVIGSPNSAAPDLVHEGVEGFVVPVQSMEELANRLAWCHQHRDVLHSMRAAARRRAQQFTWEAFRLRIGELAANAGSVNRPPLECPRVDGAAPLAGNGAR